MLTYKSPTKSYLLLVGFSLLYFCIVVNLYFIQIKQQHFFTTMGDKQYNITITTLPPRAEIYDRNGTVLAMNKNMLSAFILPQSIEHPEATSAFLKKYFPEEFQEVEKKRKKKFCFLKRNLSETEIDLIKNSGLKDIHILEEPSRFYPHPSTGTVIGITNIDNLGTLGLEQQYNRQLSGLPTTFFLKKIVVVSVFTA